MIFPFYLLGVFLLGSIPFGLLVGKIWFGTDVRKEGSGNIGMTNVMRLGGLGPGITTFLLDFSKGYLAVEFVAFNLWILNSEQENQTMTLTLVGCTVVLGHVFSIFLKFRGGKGISTLFGILASLNLTIGLLSAAIWLILFLWKRISSLSALTMLVFMPWLFILVPWIMQKSILWGQFFMIIALSLLLIYKHRDNLRRLISGEEGILKS